MKQQHIGSDFDDFLRDEGILADVDETFTRQVDEFIQQYHQALEALARQ